MPSGKTWMLVPRFFYEKFADGKRYFGPYDLALEFSLVQVYIIPDKTGQDTLHYHAITPNGKRILEGDDQREIKSYFTKQVHFVTPSERKDPELPADETSFHDTMTSFKVQMENGSEQKLLFGKRKIVEMPHIGNRPYYSLHPKDAIGIKIYVYGVVDGIQLDEQNYPDGIHVKVQFDYGNTANMNTQKLKTANEKFCKALEVKTRTPFDLNNYVYINLKKEHKPYISIYYVDKDGKVIHA
ncbi:hypothetical protein DdX_19626 [Ditylenchus destructor]|uniref:Uncharacterized protein n=1 Tax=Ditylenchus destructor TaxID=166010 RepID=A0AAD4QU39_9BILA|nr:hypothetical protein DdX_19626 [Ditylenchus destructor]